MRQSGPSRKYARRDIVHPTCWRAPGAADTLDAGRNVPRRRGHIGRLSAQGDYKLFDNREVLRLSHGDE